MTLEGPKASVAEAAPLRLHGIEVDLARRRVRIEGREVDLTDQEFRLLHLLVAHAGIVFSREALLSKIWRGDTFVTVWGVGYKFADVAQ